MVAAVPSRSDTELAELLSQLTGHELHSKQVTRLLIFLSALSTVLVGVTYADSQVTDEEKQRLQRILTQFIPSNSSLYQLVRLILKGVQQHKAYRNSHTLTQLVASLSESEKLLLIAFGYEIAAADGSIDPQEQKYLQALAHHFGIDPQHASVLETGLAGQALTRPEALQDIYNLLAPVRFQSLDPVFANAASNILKRLPAIAEPKHSTHQKITISYEALRQFQEHRQRLSEVCAHLLQAVQQCSERKALPKTLQEKVETLLDRLQSQRFRLAVVGEFSQGKSTLLNALLGEEVQPVRAIPCSGTVTVLRYGKQKRVICRYRDGREEEIPFDQYQDKASISESAALSGLSDELAQSTLTEIVLEHPDLEICRHGVEIIDSPGLNEHPERTTITQQLLKDTDAAIFLGNASRPLTQGERELLQDLKAQLMRGREDDPADNLFILINFMDLLRRDRDRQQVRQLVENFAYGQTPLIAGENRLHFVSAQAALDAMLENQENEYLTAFQNFTQALEQFLTVERGALEIRQAANALENLTQEAVNALVDAEAILDGKVSLTEAEKHKIVEQIGEASGRDTRIQLFTNELIQETIAQVGEAWQIWAEGIGDRMGEKSAAWSSQHQEKEKMLQDYSSQFMRDLTADLDGWVKETIQGSLLKESFKILNQQIHQELAAIQSNLKSLDAGVGSHLSQQFDSSLANAAMEIHLDSSETESNEGLGFLMGGGGLAAGALVAFIGFGFLPALIAGGAIGALVGWFFGESQEEVELKLKTQVFEKGFERLENSAEQIFENICHHIEQALSQRAEIASHAIHSSISMLNRLLEQQEKMYQETLEQRQAEKTRLDQGHQELAQIQHQIETIRQQANL